MSSGGSARSARLDRWSVLLAVAVIVGALLRIPGLDDTLFGDELMTYFDVTGRSLGGTVDFVQSSYEITPPLYLLLANLTQGLGDPQDALRIVPFACGLMAILLTWMLGVRVLDRKAATVAAGVVSLTPLLIFYSSEARAYSLMMVLVLGSTLALWQALHTRAEPRRWWLLYAVCTCAAMYTHYTAAFVLIGQGAWALAFHRGAWRWLLGANALAALAWLPWFSSYRDDQGSPGAKIIEIIHPFGLRPFVSDVGHWAAGHPVGSSITASTVPGDAGILLIVCGVAAGVAAVGWELIRGERELGRPSDGQALVIVLTLAAPVVAAVYSVVGVSVFAPRNLISSSPGLALLLGAIVTRPRATRLWVPATALLLAGFAVGGLQLAKDAARRPDFKGVARYLQTEGGPDAVVVDVPVYSPGPLSALEVSAAPGQRAPALPTYLRLGGPTRAAYLRSAEPGGGGLWMSRPVPSPEAVAQQAIGLARGRDIYLSRAGAVPAAEWRAIPPFLAAVGAEGYRPVAEKTAPGLFGTFPVRITVLRRVPGAR